MDLLIVVKMVNLNNLLNFFKDYWIILKKRRKYNETSKNILVPLK